MASKGWTAADIERLKKKGVRIDGAIHPRLKSKSDRANKEEPKGLRHMKEVLWLLKIPYESEYRFHGERMWRFDLAIVDRKIGIEYEGLVSQKSGHTTLTGYTGNCEKYNQAQLDGWRVFRFTVLNYKDFYKVISQAI